MGWARDRPAFLDMSLTIWSAGILHLALRQVLPPSDLNFFLRLRVACVLACFLHASCGTGFHHGNPAQLCCIICRKIHALWLHASRMRHASWACSRACVRAQTMCVRVCLQVPANGRPPKTSNFMEKWRLKMLLVVIIRNCAVNKPRARAREFASAACLWPHASLFQCLL